MHQEADRAGESRGAVSSERQSSGGQGGWTAGEGGERQAYGGSAALCTLARAPTLDACMGAQAKNLPAWEREHDSYVRVPT